MTARKRIVLRTTLFTSNSVSDWNPFYFRPNNYFNLQWTFSNDAAPMGGRGRRDESRSLYCYQKFFSPPFFSCVLPKQKISTPEGFSRISQFKKSFLDPACDLRNSSDSDGWWHFFTTPAQLRTLPRARFDYTRETEKKKSYVIVRLRHRRRGDEKRWRGEWFRGEEERK